jgi:diguanylate cyclase (GGDEF)-like protein
MEAGAGDVVFDVDFSLPSSAEQDQAFAVALEAAGGFAHLAAFQQAQDGSGAIAVNMPLDLLRAHAAPVSVTLQLDADGLARSYPLAMRLGDALVPSAATVLAQAGGGEGTVLVDFSIDPASIDRISAVDVLKGRVDGSRLAGKNVIIGASAVELRDYFIVPRHGPIPGAVLQALAGETVKQNRILEQLPWPVVPIALAALCGAFWLARRMKPLPALGLGLAISASLELISLLMQQRLALVLDTAALHLVPAAMVLAVTASELIRRRREYLRAEADKEALRRILNQVITDNFDGVAVIDDQSVVVVASRFAIETFGEALVGSRAERSLPAELSAAVERVRHLEAANVLGEVVLSGSKGRRTLEYVLTRSHVLRDKLPTDVVCLTFRDVTEKRANEQRLAFLSQHDPLTGLYSRGKFIELIDAATRVPGNKTAVVIAELRRFRIINDTLGHGMGDEVLKQVATRLRGIGPDAVARLGGDTFAILIDNVDLAAAQGYCRAIAEWLTFPYELSSGHQATIAASVGATCVALSGPDPELLLSHADAALSVARSASGNGVAMFEPDWQEKLEKSRALDLALRGAVAQRQLRLLFQPQIDMRSGEVVGAEALMRWEHPELGTIAPDQFIRGAEETGLIIAMGKWALQEACRTALEWPSSMTVAVNVSPVQFELTDVAATVREALEGTGLPASRLEIEITEGVLVSNAARTIAQLNEVRSLGVSVALDDFGTGYSSLSYLGQLPVDKLKIDQVFVRKLPDDPQAGAIVAAVMQLAQSLNKRVVAEGIETEEQAAVLRSMGCVLAQGYWYGRPAPADQIGRRDAA